MWTMEKLLTYRPIVRWGPLRPGWQLILILRSSLAAELVSKGADQLRSILGYGQWLTKYKTGRANIQPQMQNMQSLN